MSIDKDISLSFTTVIAIIVYAVSISAYVFGLRGDVNRLEENLNRSNAKLQRVVDEEISLMRVSAKHDESLDFVWSSCCSDVISTTVKVKKEEK